MPWDLLCLDHLECCEDPPKGIMGGRPIMGGWGNPIIGWSSSSSSLSPK